MIINWLCKIFKAYKTCDLLKEKEKEAEYWKQEYFKKCVDYNVLLQKYEDLKRKYLEDIAYYESRIKQLTQTLAKAIVPPDIKLQETPEEIYWNEIEEAFRNQCNLVEIELADLTYYTLSKEEFERILKAVNEAFLNKVKYEWPIWDCDNYALFMSALTRYVAYKILGLEKQLAICICWSQTHAFNSFIDKNRTVWIWEPQTASVIGKAIDYKDDQTYGIKYVWFMS